LSHTFLEVPVLNFLSLIVSAATLYCRFGHTSYSLRVSTRINCAWIALLFETASLLAQTNAQPKSPPPFASPPLSPAESAKLIHVRPGYEVELVASEPLLESPVAIDWDEQGRMWVVEMVDYPLGVDGKGKPGGRLRILEDTDGDGKYDKSTLVADGLRFPTGVITWRGGAIVTAAPEILLFKDAKGDGKTWTQATSPNPGGASNNDSLSGVAATSATNAWAVGRTGSGETLIERWRGTAWKRVATSIVCALDVSGCLAALWIALGNCSWMPSISRSRSA
jgi:glucose/arabinose dehydrogenase